MKYVAFHWHPNVGQTEQPVQMTVIEDGEPQVTPTGLLNSDGVPLYRVRETVPIGFHVSGRKPPTS